MGKPDIHTALSMHDKYKHKDFGGREHQKDEHGPATTLLYQSRECGEAQERLPATGATSFLRYGKWDDEWNTLMELNRYGGYGGYDHG